MSRQKLDGEDIPEFDFSKGKRGLHYAGPNARLIFPSDRILLDPEIKKLLSEEATRDGISLDELVNEMLKREIEQRKLDRR